MTTGAASVDESTNALLAALNSAFSFSVSNITYGFMPGGTSYSAAYGGTGVAAAVTTSEMAWAAGEFAEISNVSALTFTEVSYASNPMITLIKEPDIGQTGVAGYAQYPFLNQSEIVVEAPWWGAYGVLVHEIGHALGLKHPFEDVPLLPGVSGVNDPGDFGFNSEFYTMMSYRGPEAYEDQSLSLPNVTNLSTLDIAILQARYGANSTYRTGDDTYGDTQELIAIWDAGGEDAIDFSGEINDAVIDLRAATLVTEAGGAGFLSYVQTGTYSNGTRHTDGGYTIAYGVTIENGIGGDGHDKVTGNTADNSLSGNAGNDTIDGGAGNDDIVGGIGDDSILGGLGDDTITGSETGTTIQSLDLAELNTSSITNRSLEVTAYSEMPDDLTLDFTVQLETGVSDIQWLVSYDGSPFNPVHLELAVWNDSSPWLWAIKSTGFGAYSTVWTGIAKSEIADGELHRLTMTRDASSGAVQFYLDGQAYQSDTMNPGVSFTTGQSLVFGQNAGNFFPSGNPGDDALRGSIGEVRVYDRVLNSTEVDALDSAPMSAPYDASLVSYWRGDGSGGTSSFADQTGGSAMTLVNVAAVSQTNLSSDDDSLSGGGGNDTVDGYIGDDLLMGDDGDDILLGGTGNDSLYGGDDNDRADGSTGDDMLDGGLGNDTLNGGNGADTLIDSSGNNTFRGQGGDDTITGGLGNDEIAGGIGNDSIDGGGGDDNILGQGNIDTLGGGAGNDELRGGSANDLLYGGDDDDVLYGQGNNDVMYGDDGDDRLVGATGQDTLFGGIGNDSLFGGTAGDVLDGGAGDDLMNGGAGLDRFVFSLGSGFDMISGFGVSQDRIELDIALFDPVTYPSGPTGQQVIDNFSSAAGTGTDLSFDGGDTLRVLGVAANNLVDYIDIV